jgi:hypothetical protein
VSIINPSSSPAREEEKKREGFPLSKPDFTLLPALVVEQNDLSSNW